MIRIAIIQFPGSNCETESIAAVKRAGMEPVEFLWNGDYDSLKDFDGYMIVGGFSYQDRSRAGVIASLDPVMDAVRKESLKGKPVLGICNGAQILVETGLVPGLANHKIGMALAPNKCVKDGHVVRTGYYNQWAHLKMGVDSDRTAFTRKLTTGDSIFVPFAHAEGRYVIPDDLLAEMQANGQIPFQYATADGIVDDSFPTNPNGSVNNVCAVTNPAGNVMAMMPHPERVENGDAVFDSIREYIETNQKPEQTTCTYNSPAIEVGEYSLPEGSFELPIKLIITDNTALSVQKALNNAGIDVSITRKTHWEINYTGDEKTVKAAVIETGELFNSNKEFVTQHTLAPNKVRILVHDRGDTVGQAKLETLQDRLHVKGLNEIRNSVLWEIESNTDDDPDFLQKVINTHILWNPFYQSARIYS